MIILIGGADEIHSHDVLKTIIKQNDIKTVAIILSATKYKTEVFEDYQEIFKKFSCEALTEDKIDHPVKFGSKK